MPRIVHSFKSFSPMIEKQCNQTFEEVFVKVADWFDKTGFADCLIGSVNREPIHALMITFLEIAECDHKRVITKLIFF